MYARRYINLLTEHIRKEEDILFDMADQSLANEEDEAVANAFQEFEDNIVGVPAHERFYNAIDSLASKYFHAIA